MSTADGPGAPATTTVVAGAQGPSAAGGSPTVAVNVDPAPTLATAPPTVASPGASAGSSALMAATADETVGRGDERHRYAADSDDEGEFGNGTAAMSKLSVADRRCWSLFRMFLVFAASLCFVICVFWLDFFSPIRLYSAEYFVACAIGGAIGGTPHLVVVPLDLLKCRTQVGEYASFTEGLAQLKRESAKATAFGDKVNVWFRGWFPTGMGYTTQGAAKFGLYELFKYTLAANLSYEFANAHLTAIFIVAAAGAELIADCFLAPWEAIKVRLQTSRQYPPIMAVVMPRVWSLEGFRGYFKGLPALWARQIPYTIVKFATFENTVRFLVQAYADSTGSPAPNTGPIFLMLTVTGGYIAGALCATASHPADTVISKLNQRQDASGGRGPGLFGLLLQMPCRDVWKGWGMRVAMVGTLTALQWIGYDGFKFVVGLPTTGRGKGAVGAVAPAK
eukprot:CAMPEP_0174842850 /NCGR_PEP_ID=MMETSP1114-20130205/10156_1 /TAXON_ID=312471 /ORGANISM="Neobodo designis, Strain CCAP 1951/1" /LENGTH=449 /DNA_ID=CAMNT_0016077061 /DNA_START=216 /DNA_END=1565 /DNA_ORIENTATION=+